MRHRSLPIILMLLALAFVQVWGASARAEVIGTDQVVEQKVLTDREKVKAFLARASVQARIVALGVRGGIAQERVDGMTDQEVAQIARRIDSLPAGGNLSQQDWIIVLLLIILVAVLV